jgi:hypothetical protein
MVTRWKFDAATRPASLTRRKFVATTNIYLIIGALCVSLVVIGIGIAVA